MLSHAFKSNVTTGYMKGTPTSNVVAALQHLSSCAPHIGHPLFLPIVFLSHDLSIANDKGQRDARDWLRRLENAVSLRQEVEDSEKYFQDGVLEIDGLNRDLVECHSNVMWKRPQAFYAVCEELDKAMERFRLKWLETDRDDFTPEEKDTRIKIDKMHRSLVARIDFNKVKLKGLKNYIYTTLERLKVQREAVSFFSLFVTGDNVMKSYMVAGMTDHFTNGYFQLYNIMSQREARLNLEIAGEQRRIANASKRDSTAMKGLSLMGALFLPGTYLASVFSMTFFNFQSDANPVVSSDLWIYFIVTIPITAVILLAWMWFDRRRERKYKQDDEDLEKNIEKMEKDIMFHLRKRTMSKVHTWNTVSQSTNGSAFINGPK